jgi:tetraprenyl-beta-curcumene synthase
MDHHSRRDLSNPGTLIEGACLPPDASLRRFLTGVLPQVSRELRKWHKQLDRCYDLSLRKQASASLNRKRFHSQGGSFFALYNPPWTRQLAALIVALQTIGDYLDNLCDRGGIYDEAAFRRLHQAMLDAVSPGLGITRDYYRFYPARNDGGYLKALVDECRSHVSALPSYAAVHAEVLRLVALYNDLQVFKHLAPPVRCSRLKRWFREKGIVTAPPVYWWEFAAACGSTLAIFALLAAATAPHTGREEVKEVMKAYFPWVCGLHILLDYWIDQEEDRHGGDLNFAACYASPAEAAQRLHLFLQRALAGVSRLPHPGFHRTIVRGLLAVYLSDPKVERQGFRQAARSLLAAGGAETGSYYRSCLMLRRLGLL